MAVLLSPIGNGAQFFDTLGQVLIRAHPRAGNGFVKAKTDASVYRTTATNGTSATKGTCTYTRFFSHLTSISRGTPLTHCRPVRPLPYCHVLYISEREALVHRSDQIVFPVYMNQINQIEGMPNQARCLDPYHTWRTGHSPPQFEGQVGFPATS